MDILDYIPQIAAAGAMGVSILCIIRVAGLLKKEQEQDNPRPVFLRSIYIFMGFGLIMTLVSLGIEVSRFFMGTDNDEIANVVTVLRQVEADEFYSVNGNGNPVSITVDAGGETFTLSEAYPDSLFNRTPLNLVTRNDRYYAVKNNSGEEITYGYFSNEELKSRLAGLFPSDLVTPPPPPSDDGAGEPETFYAAGIAYTPANVKNGLSLKGITDRNKANRRLIDFLSAHGDEDDALREEAVKLLMQPRMMDRLSVQGHDRLIELLSGNEVRIPPWRYYEAAQVYLSRYQLNGEVDKADLEQHLNLSREYIRAFNNKGWSAEDHPGEYAYYQSAVKALGLELACETCLLDDRARLKK